MSLSDFDDAAEFLLLQPFSHMVTGEAGWVYSAKRGMEC
jgi:hypothetical protein